MPGPIRKKDSERRRRNKDAVETTIVDLDSLIVGDVIIPEPPMVTQEWDEDEQAWVDLDEPELAWHPQAMLIWESAKRSGQAIFMEPSDWSALYLMCEQIHRSLKPAPTVIGEDSDGKPIVRYMEVPMPGATLNAITKMMGSLMFTEGDRRRVRIELERRKRAEEAASGPETGDAIVLRREDAFRAG
jgi:hypothetical protein